MTESSSEVEAPYAHAAWLYRKAGWEGVLPLPAHSKQPVPKGWTGNDGGWPSNPDVQSWIDDGFLLGERYAPASNIALRLPHHIIGIDVDNYADKLGLISYGEMLGAWGPLPKTWRSSSRSDGHSGIYLFNVPDGLAWPGAPKPGIEIIQYAHRYVVSWPSVHPEGPTYRWYEPNGAVSLSGVPQVDELPALPEAWVVGLTGGALRADVIKASLSQDDVNDWVLAYGGGVMCHRMGEADARYVNELAHSGLSRHDVAMRATARIARMISEGHSGGLAAIMRLRQEFDDALEKTPHRNNDVGEWDRLIEGAVSLAAVAPIEPRDPCWDPFTTLLNERKQPSVPGSTAPPNPSPLLSTAPPAPTPVSGTTPSAPSPDAGALTPAQQLLAIETERQRAQRGARRTLDEEEAAALFRVPVWTRTLTEELALPDEEMVYTVADVLPVGANVLLVAQFKAGKTTLVNSLTRSLVDGPPFLGQFVVSGSHRVGIFNYEVGRGMYRRWMRDAGIENSDHVTVLNLRGLRLPLIVPRIEDWVVKWLVDHEITCWIVDPFAGAFVGSGLSENDNGEVGRFLDALDTIKARAGVRELIMPTHTGRMVQEQGSERSRGASRLDDWADVRWILTTDKEKQRYFRASGRDVEFDEVKLGYDDHTRRVFIDGPGRAKAAAGDLADQIIAAVRVKPGINTSELKNTVTGNAAAITAAIASLKLQGRLRLEQAGKSHLHYIATPPPSAPALRLVDSPIDSKIDSGIDSVDSDGSRGNNSGHPERGRNLIDSGMNANDEPESEPESEKTVSIALTRPQLEARQKIYREHLMAGGRPEIQPNGELIDKSTAVVLWVPADTPR